MLPGIHGIDVCRILKNDKDTSDISIIMLTALGQEEDIVKGLEIGADDYVTKPFSFPVLKARIHTVLRRVKNEQLENEYFSNSGIVISSSCLLYTSPSPRDATLSRMPSSA